MIVEETKALYLAEIDHLNNNIQTLKEQHELEVRHCYMFVFFETAKVKKMKKRCAEVLARSNKLETALHSAKSQVKTSQSLHEQNNRVLNARLQKTEYIKPLVTYLNILIGKSLMSGDYSSKKIRSIRIKLMI